MKTAVYGGAFNPVHNEHIAIMRNLLHCGYDRVIALISGNPPHKVCEINSSHRLAMLKMAIKGLDGVIIDDIELRSDDIHYAADVLPIIKSKYGDFTYVLGGDSIIDLHKWSRPQSIMDMCPITVYARGEREHELRSAIDYWRSHGASIKLADYRPKNISSTLIRYLAMLGIYEDVASEVQEYIKLHSLYDNYKDFKEILKLHLKPARYEHCLRTCECALRLNHYCKLNLDYDKVFLSALLHDCGKGSSRFDIIKASKPLKENADEED
ncbi:MAG: nicotinate (nicotinamide) nucleotide adenylyltransferase, partial [Clostridia bacterium]|nr:nicotinate (nicotinamide) nucleotide adenylyltransferase [Clostridia bacterium]